MNDKPQARRCLINIEPYKPGRSKAHSGVSTVYKLSSNENPHGASPKAIEAAKQALGKLHLYPDGGAIALREALGAKHNINPAQIVCGAGSDELLSLLAYAYLEAGDEGIYSQHGFLVYDIAITAAGARPVKVPEKNLTADVDALLAALTPRTKIIYLANPNNPTGTYLPFNEIKRLHAGLPSHVLLVLDAAYAEYVEEQDYNDGLELAKTAANVVMTRTYSKIYGLASLRIGWCVGAIDICETLNRIRPPFNLSAPAQAAAVAALSDDAHVSTSIKHNALWREKLAKDISALGLSVTPSVGNFLLVHFPTEKGRNAASADEFLQSHGLIVRRMEAYGLSPALRISIGCENGNTALLAALKAFMKRPL